MKIINCCILTATYTLAQTLFYLSFFTNYCSLWWNFWWNFNINWCFFYGCQVCRPPPPQMTKYVTLFFPLLRPGDPWTAALLRAAVPEPTGDAGESLRGAPARPGHSPDASPPHHAPLGCLPGIREAAAPGLYSTYTYSHERCWDITTIWWLFCLERAQNAHKPNLPPLSSLNSNSSWSHQLNKSKANEVAQGLPG